MKQAAYRLKCKGIALYNKLPGFVRRAITDESGEMYIGEVIKIIIAIVLGILLLGALTYLFVNVILPLITQKVTGMFNGTP